MQPPAPADSGLRPVNVTPPLWRYLVLLWSRRDFAVAMATGEFKAQHANTVLGGLWYLLNPLLQLGVYYLVFGVLLGIDRGLENFIGFLATGIFVYQFIQRSVTQGAAAMSKNQSLIRSLQFPRALLPLASLLREALTLRVALVVVAVILLSTGEPLRWTWLLAAPLLVLTALFSAGAAFIAARLADKVKDIENVLPFLFRLGFYASGVLFLAERFISDEMANPGLWLSLFIVNPIYSLISLVRHYTMTSLVQEQIGWMWLSAVSWTVTLAVVGLIFFRAGETTYGRG